MGKIKVLDNHTISQIAAGEVIENPASVVKELIENSIDAGSTKIEISIEEGGLKSIQIDDDGIGMTEEEIQLSVLRHATSKITSPEDLFKIKTLGFRGEALASIASISKLKITSCPKDDLSCEGTQIEFHGGDKINSTAIGRPYGTTILVSDIFYNTPARKKFLNTSKKETQAIIDTVIKLSLSHPNISFKLIDNGKLIFQTHGVGLINAIATIFSKDVSKNLIPLNYRQNDIMISGFIGRQTLSRSNRNYQFIFLNGRYIYSKPLISSIENAYKTLIMVNRYPVFFINIEIAPELVDVNIHPKKISVRFQDLSFVCNTLFAAIHSALENIEIPKMEIAASREPLKQYNRIEAKPITIWEDTKVENIFQRIDYSREKESIWENIENKINHVAEGCLKNETPTNRNTIEPFYHLFGTYILGKDDTNLYIIDQHAAHERILYEKIKNKFYNGGIEEQILISPITLFLSPLEWNIITENINTFKKFGFLLEDFGKNTIIVRSIPSSLSISKSEAVILQIADIFRKDGNTSDDLYDSIIITMACKQAVKSNDTLTLSESRKLIDDLFKTQKPYTCPHGRPTIYRISEIELEKYFKRV